MKAVRGADGGVTVDDVDEPPGTGELLEMRATFTFIFASRFSLSRTATSTASGRVVAMKLGSVSS